MPNHMPPPETRCAHKNYGLSCDDYDRLVEHAAGVCQVCGIAPERTPHGFLVVDHDAMIGQWAVRGLLCTGCNTAIGAGATPEWAQGYLAAPWWRHELEARGVECAVSIPEPPIGSEVVAPRNIHWRRTTDGWEHTAKYGGPPRSWAFLVRRYGVHNLRIAADPDYQARTEKARARLLAEAATQD